MAGRLDALAGELCGGRLVAVHEGGYSDVYVPFCGLAVIEALSGRRTAVADPYLPEVTNWGYQGLQPQQEAVVAAAEALLPRLREKCAGLK